MNRLLFWLVSPLFLMSSLAVGAESSTNSVQQEKHFETHSPVTAEFDYLLFLPKGYDKSNHDWPLILFLHGSGESGSDLAKVKRNGPPKYVESHPDFPFILVSPQSNGGWNSKALFALLHNVMGKYRVDSHRVYLTGLSMGGGGTWELAAEHPKTFAAIVPVSGWADPKDAQKLGKLPIWVFHGENDKNVSVEGSRKMVAALKAAGNPVKYTEFPGARHNIWKKTYDNPELYQWLLAQKR